MQPRTKISDNPGYVQSIDDAFTCPKCGESLISKAYDSPVLYCSERTCPWEAKESQMTPEQRFYVKVLRERGHERTPTEAMRETVRELTSE